MSIVLGIALGAGVLLAASPWLWPPERQRHEPRRARLREALDGAGLPGVSVAAAVAGIVVSGLVLAAAAFALTGIVVLAVAAAVLGMVLPPLALRHRRHRRARSVRGIWPDVAEHLLSAIRSGLSLPEGVAGLGDGGPAETRSEFAAFAGDYEANGNFSVSLDRLKARLADPVADRLIETLRMAREVGGGEIGGVLRELSDSLRREEAVRAEAESRQSWVVNAARLGVAAPWIVLVLLASRPEAAAAYDSPLGAVVVSLGLAVTAVAYRIMVAIGRLPEERRWFA